jgi:hypothetical protein
MRRLSKILFAILIGLSFVGGPAIASPSSYRLRPRGPRSYKHGGKHGKIRYDNYSFGSGSSSNTVTGAGKGGGAGKANTVGRIRVRRPPKKRNLLASPPK